MGTLWAPGGYRLGSRLVGMVSWRQWQRVQAAGPGTASTPERRLPGYHRLPEIPRTPMSNCAGRRPTEPPGEHPHRPAADWRAPPRLFTGHSESVCGML